MNHEKRIKDVTVRSVLSSNVYKMIGFRMSSLCNVVVCSKFLKKYNIYKGSIVESPYSTLMI